MHVHTHHFSVTQKQSQPSWLKTEKSGRQVLEIIKFPQGGGYPEKNPHLNVFSPNHLNCLPIILN